MTKVFSRPDLMKNIFVGSVVLKNYAIKIKTSLKEKVIIKRYLVCNNVH